MVYTYQILYDEDSNLFYGAVMDYSNNVLIYNFSDIGFKIKSKIMSHVDDAKGLAQFLKDKDLLGVDDDVVFGGSL